MSSMCWKASASTYGELVLHLYVDGNWKPYTQCPNYAIADYTVPKGSKGYATMQRLLKLGWKIVPAPNSQTDSLSTTEE